MPPISRKLKTLTFRLNGLDFQCQLKDWKLNNNTPDGERFYTYCGPGADGEMREEAEPDYALELKFFADFRVGGISDFLYANDNATATYYIDHHPDLIGEHVRWTGTCKIKAPPVGGEARTTEMTEITLPVFGKPVYTRIP